MAAVLPILEALIVLSAIGACSSGLVAVLGVLYLNRSTKQQAKKRWRSYRERLRRARTTSDEAPEDRQLRALIDVVNLRRGRRTRMFLAARIQAAGSPGPLDCTILDISDTGARLAFGYAVDLPRTIELEIGKLNRRIQADVIWCRGNMCGVRFIDERPAREPFQPARSVSGRQVA